MRENDWAITRTTERLKAFGRISGHLIVLLWGGVRQTLAAIHLAPLVCAAALCLFFAWVGQFKELYVSYAEEIFQWLSGKRSTAVAHVLAALVAMVLLSIAIYTANYVLGRFHRASVFSDSPDGVIDPEVQSSVRAVGVFAALLPWFGMLSGIFAALRDTIQRIDALKPAAAMGGGRAAYFSTEFSMVNFNDLGTFRTWLSNIEFIDQYWPAIGWVALIWLAIVLVWRLRKELPALVVGPFISERSLFRPKLRSVNPRHPGAPPPRATSNPGARQRSPWRVSSRASYLAVVVIAIIVLAKLFMPAVLSHVAGDFSGGGVAPNGEVHVRAKSISEVIVGIGGIFLPSFLSPIEIWLTTMLIVSIPLVLACVSISRRAKSLTRRSPTLALVLWGVVGILACGAAACFAAGLITYNWIELSRLLGPLGLSVLLFLTIFALIAALSVAGRELGIPALFVLAGVAAAISLVKLEVAAWSYLVAAVLLIVAAISVYWRRPRAAFVLVCLVAMTVYGTITRTVANSTNQTVTKHAFGSLTELFQKWVAARERQIATYRAANGQRPYPVFVIAAEGGGIYAAAAVSTFLARMQEACPSFAQHIFAISAVSGGAVGSMAWHYALKAKRPEFAREGCIGAGGKGSIQNAIRKVIQADHLSPLAGLLVADVLGTYDDRARGLEWSLRRSIENNVRAIPRSEIAQLYQHHWDPKKPAPAQVFNATWVRVGNRVVFAPFNMEATDLATLNTFHELGTKRKFAIRNGLERIGFIESAVISARFPGIIAAYEARHYQEDRRWHFVDGGYVDASGALTAHDIYKRILKAREENRKLPPLDVRMIILTSTQKSEAENGIKGAASRDVAAPLLAVLNVRSLLSRNAVRETITKLSPGNGDDGAVKQFAALRHPSQRPPSQQRGKESNWKVAVVELNQDEFKLELGWKISGLTYDIVSMQLGQASLCEAANAKARQPREATDTPEEIDRRQREQGRSVNAEVQKQRKAAARARNVAKTIRANSCVQHNILRLLGAK